jgi:hypothetical protein
VSNADAIDDPRLRSVPRAKINAPSILISDALPFGRLWYAGPNGVGNAIGYAQHRSRSHDAVIRVYDEAGNVIETHKHKGDFNVRRNVFWSRRAFVPW